MQDPSPGDAQSPAGSDRPRPRRRWLAAGLVGLWALVSLAHLSRLVEPPASPPGQEVAPLLGFFRRLIPPNAGYLYVLPGEFGSDTGTGPRLRYDLFPRRYEDVRATEDEATVRALMRSQAIAYVVVPDATLYSATHWIRQDRAWFHRVELDTAAAVLEAAP